MVRKYKAELVYLLFGVMTTAVNYLGYFLCYYRFGFSAAVSNGIAWVVAVLFAFLTNKSFVFESHDWSRKTVLKEILGFLSCRVVSGAVETGILWIAVDMLGLPSLWMKIFIGVIVIVVNYFGSKFLVFHKK